MSGGLKGKQVEEVRRADRSKVYGVNHSGAVPSWSRRFENYYQYNDYRFSKAGGYGGKSQQDSKGAAGRVDVGSQRESAEKGKSVRTTQVQKALFTSEAVGSLVSVEQSSDLVVQTEATKNGEKYAVEVAGEDVLGEADPVLKTNDETGMADDTSIEIQMEKRFVDVNGEDRGDDLMEGLISVYFACFEHPFVISLA
ncbi:hypothetical protein ISN44_Un97g000050 [Arabidopsis suecica]|uniref:Uncharacterized protein n=1 Tax=Arabidopsis suecica TaxID=45249 RepID=A0A8T1XC47_ARASU|nr:hypothetical protein ISN44_Un97g000050 [Arabidopsis suecica]